MIKLTETSDGFLTVQSPYNVDFVYDLKQSISAKRFDRESRSWIVPSDARDVIESLLTTHYGWQPDNSDLVTVHLVATEEISALHDSVRCAGYPIARATGRDSDARVCEGVTLLSGVIISGGSVKNWRTIVRAGASFRVKLHESSVSKIEKCWKYEIIEEKSDREKLEEERARLVARIDEIDRLLR